MAANPKYFGFRIGAPLFVANVVPRLVPTQLRWLTGVSSSRSEACSMGRLDGAKRALFRLSPLESCPVAVSTL